MKSLSAAGKFKKRRYQEENHKRKVTKEKKKPFINNSKAALESFLVWFEDSQALERVINMERQKRSRDDVVSREVYYMIKRVTWIIPKRM